MNYNYMSYYNYYKYKINNNTCFIKNNHVCFYNIYNSLEKYNDGIVYVFVNQDKNLFDTTNWSNYCILSPKEINEYIQWLQDMTGIEIKKVKATTGHYGDKGFSVRVKLDKNSSFEVKLILALIRNMYEWTFNIKLKAAFLMKDIEEFKHLDLSERICIANNSLYNYNSNHSVYQFSRCKLMNNNKFLERYNAVKSELKYIHDFYSYYDFLELKIQSKTNTIESSEYITNNNVIPDDLKEILIYNYNLMKNE